MYFENAAYVGLMEHKTDLRDGTSNCLDNNDYFSTSVEKCCLKCSHITAKYMYSVSFEGIFFSE